MATQPDHLSRSIASVVCRAVERAVDQALSSLPSLPGFAPATQEVCTIDVSLHMHRWVMTCVPARARRLTEKIRYSYSCTEI